MTTITTKSLKALADNIETIYPLTPVQHGMLFHTLMQPNSGIYLQQYRYIMTMDNLNVAAFEKAWQAVVGRHQVLRSAFVHETQDEPLQVVFKNVHMPFEFLDWRHLSAEQQEAQTELLLAQQRKQGLNFNQAPLMNVTLAQLDENRYQFIRSYHHILMDAWCFSLIMVEFLQLYRHFNDNTSINLQKAPKYQDYISWLHSNKDEQAEQAFWQQQLAGFSTPTDLGIMQKNRFASEAHTALSKDVICHLDKHTSEQLRAIASEYKVTLNTLLQGAWAQTLARYAQNSDVVFGITVAGRSIDLPNIESMVGLFINTLPLRVNIDERQNLKQWLQQLQHNNLALREYEQTALTDIQKYSELGDQPLFNSIFVYENAPIDKALNFDNLEFEICEIQNRSDLNYPLTVTVLPQDSLHFELTYRCADFEPLAVQAMLEHFKQLLVNLVELSEPQNAQLQDIEPAQIPKQTSVPEHTSPIQYDALTLFAEQVNTQPNAPAVQCTDKVLSYRELDLQSTQLAQYLMANVQIKSNTLIGVSFSPSADMVVAIMAILKAGAAYVPLDPNYPKDRIEYMIEDAGLEVILTQQALLSNDAFTNINSKLLAIDDAEFIQQLKLSTQLCPLPAITLQNLAYVMYTSGTTGKPKGVMIEHLQLANFLLNIEHRYQITPQDTFLQFSTINFDISIEEIFGSLCFGAQLVIRDQDCVSDPVQFFNFCSKHNISVVSLPTAFWHQLVSYPHETIAQTLRLVIVGGEALQVAKVNRWFKEFCGPTLINTYGPTETTVTATGFNLTEQYLSGGEIPIGQPNINTTVYILDAQHRPVPQGVIGELYIGGPSLARGYLNKPEQTEQAFVTPMCVQSERLYRTGDLVSLNQNLHIEFHGRKDDQVKIRGYRIEVAEIETVMQQQHNITQCIVIPWQKPQGDKALAAYITASQKQNINQLRSKLAEQLAEYMIPAVIIELDALPLTSNGKIDKKALPNPADMPEVVELANEHQAPANQTEQLIINCWKAVLDVQKIALDDNFFALGGHSLLVIQVLSALKQQGLTITAAQLFQTPTPRLLAQAITPDEQTVLTTEQSIGGLIPEGCQQITPDMLPLINLSQQQIDAIVEKVPAGAVGIQEIYPLAPLQEGILFHHMLSPQNDPYIVRALLEVENLAVFNKLVASLNFMIQRHEVLRTSIMWRQLEKPVQLVHREARLSVEWVKLDAQGKDNSASICQALLSNEHNNSRHNEVEIDLEACPLIKLRVAKDSVTDKLAVMFIEHHIVSDHISVEIILNEISAYLMGQSETLPAAVQYKEFVARAIEHDHSAAQQYFTQLLGDVDFATLPYQLNNTQGHAGDITQHKYELDQSSSITIRQLARQFNVSPASFFHSAWALVVARASAHSDIVFGTVLSGRMHSAEQTNAMLGMFINTLPVRLNLTNLTAEQLITRTREQLEALIPHEQSALALAQRASQLSGEQPLFSAMLNYRHSHKNDDHTDEQQTLNGVRLVNVDEPSNYPFTLSVDDFSNSELFSLTLELNKGLHVQQIEQELNTAITGLCQQLTTNSAESILEHYLQRCHQLHQPIWQQPQALVFIEQQKYQPKATAVQSNKQHISDTDVTFQSTQEQLLAKIWQPILGVGPITRQSHFFELGGHSLLVMQVITALQKAGYQLNASEVFKSPVLKELATKLKLSSLQHGEDNAFASKSLPQGLSQLTPDMLPLIALSQQEIEHIIARVPGGLANLKDIYPLAPLQEGILFHHRLSQDNDPYVMPAYLKIKGTARFEQFIAGINHIIERHDTLRTAILWDHLSQPVQVVYHHAQLPVEWLELDQTKDYLEQMQHRDAQQTLSLDLRTAPLLKVSASHDKNKDEFVIRLLDHHIISDHVSMAIVQQELEILFNEQPKDLPKPVQYRGFISQLQQHQATSSDDTKTFFSKQLKGFTEPSTPFALALKQSQDNPVNELDSLLDESLSQQIRNTAKHLKLNPATLFHSAFAMVIAACSNKEDVVFGTVMSGRLQGTKGSESMLGMFINTLPLRLILTDLTPLQLVMQTQQNLMALLPYEQSPLAQIQQHSELTGETALFTSLLNYRHTQKKARDEQNSLIGLEFIDPKERTNYPFAIAVDDYGDDFLLNIQVQPPLSAHRVAQYMVSALAQLTQALTDEQNQPIMHYSVVPQSEQVALLTNHVETVAYADNICVYELLEQQLANMADRTHNALIFQDQSMSYQEFDEKTNQLARFLIEQGVQHNDYVAIAIERSFDMVIAIWAILKSGAAYLPLDVNLPTARIDTILTDSNVQMLLTQQSFEAQFSRSYCQAFALDGAPFDKKITSYSKSALVREQRQPAQSNAYLFYTSGSTGKPKGVVCNHQGLVNLVQWLEKQYPLQPSDRVLQKTPYNFDVSVWEFIWPMICGATLVIAKPEGHKDARYLTQIIEQQQISHLHFVPSMLSLMLSDGDWRRCQSVKQVFCIGEALNYELQQNFFAQPGQKAQLHNLYGPTEASVVVSHWQCQPEPERKLVPIGKPLQNTQLLVLDRNHKLAPMGAEGELYIGGVCLALGYLNRPDLNATQFIKHPFATQQNERLYRTGDLVRILEDGNFDYISRLDDQVKIRGLRIELGEIESVLNQHQAINTAQVAVKMNTRSEPNLVAYVMLQQQSKANTDIRLLRAKLKEHLNALLPSYMVPEHYVVIEQWPLTSNGKINKSLLPEPNFIDHKKHTLMATTDTEHKLVEIWSQLLNLPSKQVGIDSNFFELGGHSILAMKLISVIEAQFNLSLSLNSLFNSPTIQSIAQQIEDIQGLQSNELDFMEQLLNEFEDQE
ncbi:D-alanine--D-alanyl carrier protein ligase [Pseudoalteromonas sp. CIP111854]|uniref:D-alanine--D-alanyl carrier protein ligase n=1 Tax=Pseudoalteromonas holothuriae TaxID=2963714 RepID=A0A9W4R0V2_9GAMM|nr:non-ribosomal peptide synthetase [Pseudoalteromonas sp. CIP111854]CAH9061866.1 D-alanine--D-alanyl carrier protein ligase [Pseudoalteromonas sp. CIP111854]